LDSVLSKFAAVGKWVRREFVAARPVFVFFLVGFLLLLSIIKLVLATFSIEVTAFSKAVVGALFAAKAVLYSTRLRSPVTSSTIAGLRQSLLRP
jgi:hypothetical protein